VSILLNIGGMVAGGFSSSGEYLLAVSHSGRGVYSSETWARVARDSEPAYPENGVCYGIGPIDGERIEVREIDYSTGVLTLSSPDRRWLLQYSEGMLQISAVPQR
jgi:hypothetical protein